ncbi:MAG: PqqD family protein [bacterium]
MALNLFRRRPKAQGDPLLGVSPGNARRFKHGNPLDAIPLVPPEVQVIHTHPDGAIIIRRETKPTSRLATTISRLLRYKWQSHVQLDANGAAYWRRIDGNTPLEEIATTLRDELKIDMETARKGVLTYTRDLMKRGFVNLKIDRMG